MKVIGVDLGGTQIKAGIVDENGNILKQLKRPTEAQKGKEVVLENLIGVIQELMDGEVKAVGVAVASPLDPHEGVLYYPPNLPGFGIFNLKAFLAEKLRIPVFIDNDANLYALGEWWKGSGVNSKVFLCITVGTGIGGGVIYEGKIWHGAHGLGAEIGHITVMPEGPLCHCGNRGCLEAVASSYFLVSYVKERLSEGEASSLARFKNELTPKLIYEAAVNGDRLALRAFEILGRNLGLGVASLVNVLDPDVVAIGGGLSKAGMILLNPVIEEFRNRVLKALKDKVEIKLAVLEEFAAVLGASFLAIKNTGGVI